MTGRATGLFLAALGAAGLAAALSQPAFLPAGPGAAARIGPGFVPTGLAALLIGLGLLAALRGDGGRPLPRTARPALCLLSAVAGFALLLPVAGFLAAALVAAVLAALAAPAAGGRRIAVSAMLTTGAGALLFVLILGLPLPLLPR